MIIMKTIGKVHQTPGELRITSQPGLKNGYIWRSSGVNRESQAVLDQNAKFGERMEGNKIATDCKGKPRSQFFACLRIKGKQQYNK